jgi:hypothetical protein
MHRSEYERSLSVFTFGIGALCFETGPYLPKNIEDRLVLVGMMKRILGWYEAMQHKAMNNIFGKGPGNDARD